MPGRDPHARPTPPRAARAAANEARARQFAATLSELGTHLPKVVRVESLPQSRSKQPIDRAAICEHVVRRLTRQPPRLPASAFPPIDEDRALALLHAAVRWTGPQVFGELDADGSLPARYAPSPTVLQRLKAALPLDPRTRRCFANADARDFGQPVDPRIEANELLLVCFDRKSILTLYWAEMID